MANDKGRARKFQQELNTRLPSIRIVAIDPGLQLPSDL